MKWCCFYFYLFFWGAICGLFCIVIWWYGDDFNNESLIRVHNPPHTLHPMSSLDWQDYLNLHSNDQWDLYRWTHAVFFVLCFFFFLLSLFFWLNTTSCLVRWFSVHKLDQGYIVIFPQSGISLNVKSHLLGRLTTPHRCYLLVKMIVKSSRASYKTEKEKVPHWCYTRWN